MKRFDEIDFARALPMLFMPIVHIFEDFQMYGYLNESASVFCYIMEVISVFGPAVFMMILGMNIAFSSHTSPRELLKRGLIFIAVFLAHNAIRFFAPALTVYFASGKTEDWALREAFTYLFMSDILFFAAMAFLFFALMKKLKATPLTMMLVALVLLTLNTILFPTDKLVPLDEITWVHAIFDNFVHVSEGGPFPAFAWMPYPVFGYALGLHLKKLQSEEEREKFYGKILIVSVFVLVALCACMYSYNIDFVLVASTPANLWITDLFSILLNIPIACIWIGGMYYLYKLIKKVASQRVLGAITIVSKSIMMFYIVHWIFVGWTEYMLYLFIESGVITTWQAILVSIVITIVSLALAIPLQKKINVIKAAKRAKAEAIA